MQSLLVHSLISTSCLTLLVVDQRLRELFLRTPAKGNISVASRKMSYFAVICWQSAIWRGGSSGNQSRVQCGKIGGIARIVGGNKKARSQVSKLGVTCPLFAPLADRNIPLWTDQTPMTTTMKMKTTLHKCQKTTGKVHTAYIVVFQIEQDYRVWPRRQQGWGWICF